VKHRGATEVPPPPLGSRVLTASPQVKRKRRNLTTYRIETAELIAKKFPQLVRSSGRPHSPHAKIGDNLLRGTIGQDNFSCINQSVNHNFKMT